MKPTIDEAMNKCTRCGEVNPAEIHTCSPQTKAQRLADAFDNGSPSAHTNRWKEEAAAELRRLDELNAELVEAVANLIKVKGRHNTEIAYQRLVAAYDKAKGQT